MFRGLRPALVVALGVTSLVVVAPKVADAAPAPAAPAAATGSVPPGGSYRAVPQTRILDTRIGLGAPKRRTTNVNVAVFDPNGTPRRDAYAVVVNVIVVNPAATGHLRAYPGWPTAPPITTANFLKGQTIDSLVIAPGGGLSINSTSPTDLVADVQGYFTIPTQAGTTGLYNAVPSARLMDTRTGLGGRTPGPGGTRALQVTGRGGIPASGVSAVVLNTIVVAPTASGHVIAYPSGAPRPATSTINFARGQTIDNRAIVPVGADGKVAFYNSAGTTPLVVDVAGYFTAGDTATGAYYKPLQEYDKPESPYGRVVMLRRFVDTRSCGTPCGPIGAGHTLRVQVAGSDEILPAAAVLKPVAAIARVAAVDGTRAGSATVYATGASAPATSDLNYAPKTTTGNLAIAPLSSSGAFTVGNKGPAAAQFVVDVSGYFVLPAPSRPTAGTWGWGYNRVGIGRSDLSLSTAAVPVPGLPDVVALSTGDEAATYAVRSDGSVWAWGEGALGTAATTHSRIPLRIAGLSDITAVASGGYGNGGTGSGYALRRDGTVWAWGRNTYGQLGIGTTTESPTPQQVTQLTDVIAISANSLDAYALRRDGTVWAWGNNTSAQLGNGTTTGISTTPVQVAGLSGVTSISAHLVQAIAVRTDGTAVHWGTDPYQNPTPVPLPTPLSVGCPATTVISKTDALAALCTDGTVWTNAMWPTPGKVPGLSGVRQVASTEVTFYALNGDGTVWAWGQNWYGSFGNGYVGVTLWQPHSYADAVPVPGMTGATILGTDQDAVHVVVSG